MNTALTAAFKASRRVSTPLIAIKTPDQAITVETIKSAVKNGTEPPVILWDCIRGCQWLNEPGLEVCFRIIAAKGANVPLPSRADELDRFRTELGRATVVLVNALEAAQKLPASSVLIVMNAHMHWDKPPVIQAAWNLRDPFKGNGRTLVLLTDSSATIPSGLRDALPLAEELPSLEELGVLVDEQCEAAGLENLDKATRSLAVDAVCGLPAFNAEQSIALSFVRRDGAIVLDTKAAWDRKRALVEQTNGLSVYRGNDTFSMYGGHEAMKSFAMDLAHGEEPARAYVLIDEINDALAGSGADGSGDSSGTSQEMHGTLLSTMENRGYTGFITVGPTGTGKSAFCKALAGETNSPLIIFDFSKMKSKFVGSSNENLHAALDVVYSISQGKALFIATCNSASQLTAQLKARFSLGIFFVDLPDAAERELIWNVWLKHFKLDAKQPRPADEGWNGREIRSCCSLAWRLRKPLVYAAQYLTHASQTDADSIERLRQGASGKFLSSSYPGSYEYRRVDAAPVPTPTRTKRSIRVD